MRHPAVTVAAQAIELSECLCVFFRTRCHRSGFFSVRLATHFFFEGQMLTLGVCDGLPLAGVGAAAFARLGATLRALKIDGVHTYSL